MRILVIVHQEGITDLDFQPGDIKETRGNTWEPADKEQKLFLCAQIDDFTGDEGEITAAEWGAGPEVINGRPNYRRMRKYRLNFEAVLDAEELAAVRDKEVAVPVMVGKFSVADILRKN